ncbi:MAG: hypothetical protein ACOY6N_02175 [Pseudomonadota bacterium]
MRGQSRLWRDGIRTRSSRLLTAALALVAAPAMAGVPFVKLPSHTKDGVTWHVRKEKRSGMRMPFLVAGAPKEAIAKINRRLEERFTSDIETASNATEFSTENRVLFANRRYFVVGGAVHAYFSGAAHPLYRFDVAVFDLRTGDEANFWPLFRLAADANGEIGLTRTDALDALILRAYLRQAAIHANRDPNCWALVAETRGCYVEDDGLAWCEHAGDWTYATLYPTSQGLAVTLDIYAEQDRGCRGEGVVLPWPAVRKTLLKPVPLP